ncbi:hypothetical protein V0R55_26905, partial [Pseudomonas soli]
MTDPDNLASKSVEDRMPEELSLAGDFPKVTHEQWEEAVLKVLNRGRPEGKELNIAQGMKRLEPTTVDGIQIEPMYRRQDAPEKLGHPSGKYDILPNGAVYDGEGYATIVASVPIVIGKAAYVDEVATNISFRSQWEGLHFEGSNITFDWQFVDQIYQEVGTNRRHWLDGVTIQRLQRRPAGADPQQRHRPHPGHPAGWHHPRQPQPAGHRGQRHPQRGQRRQRQPAARLHRSGRARGACHRRQPPRHHLRWLRLHQHATG